MKGTLVLKNGKRFEGESFGAEVSGSGELVFSTGMMGYPESITDPSYRGQILVLTYPLVGNYGVPDKALWESDRIMISGLIVSNYIDTPSHFQSKSTLSIWLKSENIPALEIKDTRFLTQIIREGGSQLAKIVHSENVPFYDPNTENLVENVSIRQPAFLRAAGSKKTVILIDCGAKRNIQKALLKRATSVATIPWNLDPFEKNDLQKLKRLGIRKFDALLISNGPGDPKFVKQTIRTIQKALRIKMPILGVCLGHQLLALAAGGKTKKLKYGHRSQNQPCLMDNTQRCFITTQNHGFAVDSIPAGFNKWFTNANDGTNEGIIHKSLPIMSVQFHPEATPGPEDTEWIFDYFLQKI
jgi:carbamoyl-phosphate synthase small subunit